MCPEQNVTYVSGRSAVAGRPRKGDLLTWVEAWDGGTASRAQLVSRYPARRLPASDPWPFLRFLFLAALRDNLSDLVTRELGLIVTERVEPGTLRAQFETRLAAVDAYLLLCDIIYDRMSAPSTRRRNSPPPIYMNRASTIADMRRSRAGSLCCATEYRFVDVKSENDRLSVTQYQWLRFLGEAGIAVSLDRVRHCASTESGCVSVILA